MTSKPPIWTADQLDAHRITSISLFRRQRTEEPLEQYLSRFDEYEAVLESLLEATVDLSDIDQQLQNVLTTPKLFEAFRYLAGPPISDDDLKVVAEAVLTPTRLADDVDMQWRIAQVVLSGLDRRRFPWVIEMREPTETERKSAIVASAALLATQRLQTARRTTGKRDQEERVRQALLDAGFVEIEAREVKNLSGAPSAGQFCRESKLGDRKADVIVGLLDGRSMAIECKVSNSALNSVKRLNNDAAVKAETWKGDFGSLQIVAAAVLSGVFDLHQLLRAQERGLVIFWAHALDEMTDWIQSTRKQKGS